jgi:hypothetical protein
LLRAFINYRREKIYNIRPWPNDIKLFFFVIYEIFNRLVFVPSKFFQPSPKTLKLSKKSVNHGQKRFITFGPGRDLESGQFVAGDVPELGGLLHQLLLPLDVTIVRLKGLDQTL